MNFVLLASGNVRKFATSTTYRVIRRRCALAILARPNSKSRTVIYNNSNFASCIPHNCIVFNSYTRSMSRRCWNSVEDRRKLAKVDRLFQDVLERAYRHRISQHMEEIDDYDSDSDQSMDIEVEQNGNVYTNALRQVAHLANGQYNRVYGALEDEMIEFGQTKIINDFSDSDCLMYFRFLKVDLKIVAELLWPRLVPYLNSHDQRRIHIGDRYVAHYETCLCVYLFKMSHPCRLRSDCEHFFGIRKSKLSRMIIFFGEALCRLAIKYLTSPNIWHGRMEYYGSLVHDKCGGLFPNMWGFIDCTIRRTCVPIEYQDIMYTRYKRCHGLKFQSVVTPDGFIACLHGPYVAKRHDVRILRESGLLEMLRELMPEDESNGPIYYLYGDLAYEHRRHIFSGFRNALPNSPQSRFNREMSKVRIVVEWGFANVLRRWQYVDFTRAMKVLLIPTGQHYINCVFLTNLGNCFYGGAINQYFNAEPLSIYQYLSLVD